METTSLLIDTSLLREIEDKSLRDSLITEAVRFTNYDLQVHFLNEPIVKDFTELSFNPLIRYLRNQIYTQILQFIPNQLFFNSVKIELKNIRRYDVLIELVFDL